MKKLAMALVCLVSIAFFASCDPKTVVEHPEPSIAILEGEGYIADGDVLEMYEVYSYGFKAASNAETQVELSHFKVISGETVLCDSAISGTEFTFEGEIYFDDYEEERELVGSAEIIATVTDADGKTNSAIIKVDVNKSEDLVALPFEWKREGSHDGEGLDVFGLQWVKNLKEVYAVIEPIPGEDVTLYSVPTEKWDEVQTISDKIALFSDGGIASPIKDYRGVSAWASHEYNDVIATRYEGEYYLLHITKGTVSSKGTNIIIEGEVK